MWTIRDQFPAFTSGSSLPSVIPTLEDLIPSLEDPMALHEHELRGINKKINECKDEQINKKLKRNGRTA